jgi:hypothetical protein
VPAIRLEDLPRAATLRPVFLPEVQFERRTGRDQKTAARKFLANYALEEGSESTSLDSSKRKVEAQ